MVVVSRNKDRYSLLDMVELEIIPVDAELKLCYKGETFRGVVTGGGEIRMGGEVYGSPSAAARAATGKHGNGWDRWTYGDRSLNYWSGIDPDGSPRTERKVGGVGMKAQSLTALNRFLGGLLKTQPPSNETEVEYRVLGRVMERLGWDMATQVDWRRRVGVSSKPGVVDIALHGGDGVPLLLLEAKKWKAPLDRYVEQLMRYAFQEAAPVVVLTNGCEWRFYLPREVGDVRDRCFAEVDLERGVSEVGSVLSDFLAADRVVSGKAEVSAVESLSVFRGHRKAGEALSVVWTEMRQEPDKGLVTVGV